MNPFPVPCPKEPPLRIAYLDCFAGISGDMFLGALLGAGVPPSVLHEATASLNLGASLRIHTVDRSGISSTKVDVLEGDRIADAPPRLDQQPPTIHQHNPAPSTSTKQGIPTLTNPHRELLQSISTASPTVMDALLL